MSNLTFWQKLKKIKESGIDLSNVEKSVDNAYQKLLKEEQRINWVTPKYETALKLFNRILEHIGREKIEKLTDFVGIGREELQKLDESVWQDLYDQIFKYFNKGTCRYGSKQKIKTYIIALLRGVCKQLDLELKSKNNTYLRNDKYTCKTVYSVYPKIYTG